MIGWALSWIAFSFRLWLTTIQIILGGVLFYYVIQMHYKVRRLESSLSWFMSKVPGVTSNEPGNTTRVKSQSEELFLVAENISAAFEKGLPPPDPSASDVLANGGWIESKNPKTLKPAPEFVDTPETQQLRDKGFEDSIALLNRIHVLMTEVMTQRVKKEEVAFRSLMESLNRMTTSDKKKVAIRQYLRSLYQDTADEVHLIESHHKLRQVILRGIDYVRADIENGQAEYAAATTWIAQATGLVQYTLSWTGVAPFLSGILGPIPSRDISAEALAQVLEKKQKELDRISSTYKTTESAFNSTYGMKRDHFDALEHQCRRLITQMSPNNQTRPNTTYRTEEIALLKSEYRKRLDTQFIANQEVFQKPARAEFVQLAKASVPLHISSRVSTILSFGKSFLFSWTNDPSVIPVQPTQPPSRIALKTELSPLFKHD